MGTYNQHKGPQDFTEGFTNFTVQEIEVFGLTIITAQTVRMATEGGLWHLDRINSFLGFQHIVLFPPSKA